MYCLKGVAGGRNYKEWTMYIQYIQRAAVELYAGRQKRNGGRREYVIPLGHVKRLARDTFPYSECETENLFGLVLGLMCSCHSQACHWVLISLDALIFGCIVYTAGREKHSETSHCHERKKPVEGQLERSEVEALKVASRCLAQVAQSVVLGIPKA